MLLKKLKFILRKPESSIENNGYYLSLFSFFISLKLYTAVTIIYFTLITGSYALGISIFSIIQISQFMFEIPTGFFSDSIGRKSCLIIGAVLSLVAVVFYAIGSFYIVLIIGAIFEGMSYAFFSGNNDAFLYEPLDQTGQKERFQDSIGKMRSMPELAWFISSILGGIIAIWSFPLLMWISVIAQLIVVAIIFQIVEPKLHKEKVESVFIHLKDALWIYKSNLQLRRLSIVQIFSTGLGESAWPFYAAFYKTLMPVWAVSFFISLNFIVSSLSYRFSGRILKKFKLIKLFITQEIYGKISVFIALLFPSIFSPIIIASGSVFYGVGEVVKNSLMHDEFTDKQRATMSSINSLLGSMAYAFIAILLGVIADNIGPKNMLLIVQICTLPLSWLMWKIFTHKKN